MKRDGILFGKKEVIGFLNMKIFQELWSFLFTVRKIYR